MSVWFCIPSKRPVAEAQACVDKWHAMGYKVALWRDTGDDPVDCDHLQRGDYPGYAKAVNALAEDVLAADTGCDWVVSGGDDIDPDPNKRAGAIAAECTTYFGGAFGVMQPTGDRFAHGSIDRIAGSPWLGRAWCERANQGQGPLHPDFWHMFVDEFLMRSALKLGVFWQRSDLVHLHRHFMRKSAAIDSPAVARPVPDHLRYAVSPAHWAEAQKLFRRHQANRFAAGDPLP